mmetsp:Transcript_2409/g.5133  ORF Transcript_2409/g.5133 Transcript_2409/m.5133 type:complete len:587 (-) Transcript_2409:16-1776(-)
MSRIQSICLFVVAFLTGIPSASSGHCGNRLQDEQEHPEFTAAGVSLLQIGLRNQKYRMLTLADGEDVPLVPKPMGLSLRAGGPWYAKYLQMEAANEAADMQEASRRLFELTNSVPLQAPAESTEGGFPLRMQLVAADSADAAQAEAYHLATSEDGIEITASSSHGLFNGLMTLRQLVVQDEAGRWVVPAVDIDDKPALQWRGLMLDVARHFFTAKEVKDLLTTMALFKLNRFHWHLGDDQGWRIPIQTWQKLTEVGQWRSGTPSTPTANDMHRHDHQLYGGAYTEEDIHDVVNYANSLFIEVVPEIDLPGHVQAVVAAYPELGNTDIPGWHTPPVAHYFGAFDYTLAPNDKSFQFVRDVLDKVTELIPSHYMHLGGDEVSSKQWSQSAHARQFGKEHGIDVQSGISQIQGIFQELGVQHVNHMGRRPIVWDEASKPESHLSKEAIVMLWRVFNERDITNVADLTSRGYDVVLTPHMYTYLDHAESEGGPYPTLVGTVPLQKVYELPIPQSYGAGKVLGGQAQLWSEYIQDKPHLDYMAWPRGCALAERLWLGSSATDFSNFAGRLRPRLRELQRMGVNFRALSDSV